jgi:bisanhydrobacterioruberin hydratase
MFAKLKTPGRLSRVQKATAIAILLHAVGLVGVLYINKNLFLRATPLDILMMFLLLLWTHGEKNQAFLVFLLTCFVAGMGIEIVGVRTGALFGSYSYGSSLGLKVWGIPLILGVNWFIVLYCCGTSAHWLFNRARATDVTRSARVSRTGTSVATILTGAFLSVAYDWIMEPVATKLDFWTWHGSGQIPVYNYICWFIFSLLLLTLFQFSKFEKQNRFAGRLITIQVLFFLLLRYFET